MAFSTKPRAPDAAMRGPKSEPSRLETQPLSDLETVHVGQADVEQDHVGLEPQRLGDTGLAVVGAAHDDESLGLEHHPRHGPERGVVVDDDDRLVHGPGSAMPES